MCRGLNCSTNCSDFITPILWDRCTQLTPTSSMKQVFGNLPNSNRYLYLKYYQDEKQCERNMETLSSFILTHYCITSLSLLKETLKFGKIKNFFELKNFQSSRMDRF
jgi:hypothetical protein